MSTKLQSELKEELLERFLRYVKITTMSDPHVETLPSTPGQWDLLHLLKRELGELGIADVELDQWGHLVARVPGNRRNGEFPTIGLMAHVDTSPDMSGVDVKPQVHRDYDGNVISLTEGYILDPVSYPELLQCKGGTVITSDGTTLLGADDKAGVSEIMTALSWLLAHDEIARGDLEIVFTPDEETGRGLDRFDPSLLKASCCYTVDGGERGIIEGECFNAAVARVSCVGKVIHLGTARGKLVNAVAMASAFVSMLPRNESPEATDDRYGYYAALEISGDLDKAYVDVYLRDFETSGMERRIGALGHFAKAVEEAFPGGKVDVDVRKQYANMREHIAADPHIMELLETAVAKSGVEPVRQIIRGGTDGSRLSEMGIPTPNIFTGGHNYHSRFEWASLEIMAEACETLIHLVSLWAEQKATKGAV
ncbi:peptidase T [Sediminispirochaeta bajacaliforniensis]|uniref:peptidase T n=1 Tax=Sediminispirochaeta bajacaliforniensis TaxID=148 RepID=UPI0003603BEE|nr:peptidase T [Sediminispirochaeta bajacaliforniensis]